MLDGSSTFWGREAKTCRALLTFCFVLATFLTGSDIT